MDHNPKSMDGGGRQREHGSLNRIIDRSTYLAVLVHTAAGSRLLQPLPHQLLAFRRPLGHVVKWCRSLLGAAGWPGRLGLMVIVTSARGPPCLNGWIGQGDCYRALNQ